LLAGCRSRSRQLRPVGARVVFRRRAGCVAVPTVALPETQLAGDYNLVGGLLWPEAASLGRRHAMSYPESHVCPSSGSGRLVINTTLSSDALGSDEPCIRTPTRKLIRLYWVRHLCAQRIRRREHSLSFVEDENCMPARRHGSECRYDSQTVLLLCAPPMAWGMSRAFGRSMG